MNRPNDIAGLSLTETTLTQSVTYLCRDVKSVSSFSGLFLDKGIEVGEYESS